MWGHFDHCDLWPWPLTFEIETGSWTLLFCLVQTCYELVIIISLEQHGKSVADGQAERCLPLVGQDFVLLKIILVNHQKNSLIVFFLE